MAGLPTYLIEEMGEAVVAFKRDAARLQPIQTVRVADEPWPGDIGAAALHLSPDGKFLAYPYEENPPAPAVKLAIIPAEGGPPTKVLSALGVVWGLLWSPDGKSLQYSFSQNGAYNIWEQPLTGGEARHLTKFNSGTIFDFHWSLDGKRLLMTRGEISSDAALLSNLR